MYIKLKEFRLQQDLSISELSNLSNVSTKTIKSIELNNTTSHCKISTVMKLATALHIELDDLVDIHN